jgi:hypothetical protein
MMQSRSTTTIPLVSDTDHAVRYGYSQFEKTAGVGSRSSLHCWFRSGKRSRLGLLMIQAASSFHNC